MITLRQHMPNFISGFEPKDAVIERAEDFRTIDWVKRWEDDGKLVCWSQSPNTRAQKGKNSWLLMAEMADGKWWVVAYVDDDLGLPEWKRPVD